MLDDEFEIVRTPRIFNQAYSPLTLVQGKRERPRAFQSSTAAERSGAPLVRPELAKTGESPSIPKEEERPGPMVKANDKKQNPIDLILVSHRTDRKETKVIKTQRTQKYNKERLHKRLRQKTKREGSPNSIKAKKGSQEQRQTRQRMSMKETEGNWKEWEK